MKKTILFLLIAGQAHFCAAQDTSRIVPAGLRADYLAKAKSDKQGAIILISAGGALVIVGAIIEASNINNDIFDVQQHDETLAGVLVVTGLAAMLGSIPLFISAHKNKKRAMAISFKNELAPQLQKSMVFYKSIPSLHLTINL